jgi:hypothetical protein
MPRRGRSAPARAPPRTTMRAPTAPRPQAASQPPGRPAASLPMNPGNQTQQPSLFKQMAATAGGVAMGSAVGHMAGAAMMGGSGGSQHQEPVSQQSTYGEMSNGAEQQQYYAPQPSQPSGPCGWEISQFLKCAQGAPDITICEGFNEALRECKRANLYN